MNKDLIAPLTQASLAEDLAAPLNLNYQDIYFNAQSPIEESQFVFIKGTQLNERLMQTRGLFQILEIGFGTGLNFLLACRTFIQNNDKTFSNTVDPKNRPTLHYVSIEKHPIPKSAFRSLLSKLISTEALASPKLHNISHRIMTHYPPPIPGTYQILFPNMNISLTLLWRDALSAISNLYGTVDAFFLDGFAPNKNPDLWTTDIFQHLARLAAPNATLATFTAASQVRKGLEKTGFNIQKIKGFGHKREMITGTFPHQTRPPTSSLTSCKNIHVIGAGIAGCTTAYRLASAGYQVTLFDAAHKIAAKASGNPMAALQTPLSIFNSDFNEFQHTSAYFAVSNLDILAANLTNQSSSLFQHTGMIHFPCNTREIKRLEKIKDAPLWPEEWQCYVTQSEASDLAKCRVTSDGLFYPKALTVKAEALCQALSQHPNIQLQLNTPLNTFDNNALTILCTAYGTQSLLPQHPLNLIPIRGQLTQLPKTSLTETLNTILSGQSYLLPCEASHTHHTLGATYQPNIAHEHLLIEDHAENLKKLAQLTPEIALAFSDTDYRTFQGRAGVRTQSRDYFPLVGSIQQNCLINCGLGSRGYTHAWLCAEIIYRHIQSPNYLMPKTLMNALKADRFTNSPAEKQ